MWFFRVIVLAAIASGALSDVPATSTQTPKRTSVEQKRPVRTRPKTVRPAETYLKSGDPDKALAYCEDVIKSEPENKGANDCIARALAMKRQLKLAEAEVLASQGQREKAAQIIAVIGGGLQERSEVQRADNILKTNNILKKEETSWYQRLIEQMGAAWLQDSIIGIAALVLIWAILMSLRKMKRRFRRAYFRKVTTRKWRVLPLDDKTGLGAAELVNDAYQRLWQHLPAERDPLLLLNPDFTSSRHGVLLDFLWSETDGAPGDKACTGVCLQDLERHEPDFFDVAQQIQLKVGVVSLADIARIFQSFSNWFKAGDPTLSGRGFISADTDDKQGAVTIQLTRSGDEIPFATVQKSCKGKDVNAAREAADGAVFKMLYLLSNGEATVEEADGAESVRNTSQKLEMLIRALGDGIDAAETEEFRQIAEKLKRADKLLSLELARKLLWQGIAQHYAEHAEAARSFESAAEAAKAWILQHTVWVRTLLPGLGLTAEMGAAQNCRAEALYNQASLQDDPEKAIDLFTEVVKLTDDAQFPGKASVRLLAAIGRTISGAQLPWSSAKFRSLDHASIAALAEANEVEWPAKTGHRDAEVVEHLRPEFEQAQATILLNLATAYPKPIRARNLSFDGAKLLQRAKDLFSQSEAAEKTAHYYTIRARLCLFLGDYAKARDYAMSALKLDPNDEWATYAGAEAYFCDPVLNQYQQAIKAGEVLATFVKPLTLPPLIELKNQLTEDRGHGAAA